jgi:putative NIF3 family GTP cyclohydrolase 1 type 2
VVALGHRRSEVWGLHQLARELRADFPDLETTVAATGDPS